MLKIISIVGARPQFIKASAVSRAISKHNESRSDRSAGIVELIVHTGQHYDKNMSDEFFRELKIPEPHLNLNVGSGFHGQQTAHMLMKLEEQIINEKPDMVLIYGDTNSTLAGALAAVKLHIPVAHVEAGLRSFNRKMPEEHNRVLADHCSDLLFCPTQVAVTNLHREGISRGVHLVGDTMYDAVLQFTEIAIKRSTILRDLELKPKEYILATVHRPCNTDVPENLKKILTAFTKVDQHVIFPAHPRTRNKIAELDQCWLNEIKKNTVKIIEPVSYLDMLMLEKHANIILTDSGGVQKEAYFFGIPCVTLRNETEWIELVESGWNVLVGCEPNRIVEGVVRSRPGKKFQNKYGDGRAAEYIVHILYSYFD